MTSLLNIAGNIPVVAAEAGGQSLRFEDGDSPYLSWTPASAGNRKTWTYSTWIKRANLGGTQLFGINSGDSWMIRFSTSDKIACNFANDTVTNYFADSTRVFRDTSAWYHIVVSCDTTQATASDRVKIYVNGELETITGGATSIPQNRDTDINVAAQHRIGAEVGNRYYSDGYIANTCFIDGQQLDPTSFGEYDDTLWKPKSDTDIQSLTFGTNGFYLPFKQTTEAEGFSTVTYTGNGSTQGIEGVGFEPDFVWIKARDNTHGGVAFDAVRGFGLDNGLRTDLTATEGTSSDGVVDSVQSGGFTVDVNGTVGYHTNETSTSYVAWAWDAGDNLAPTGFSAVTYTGDGVVGRSVGGVGFDPDLVWIKRRNSTISHNLYDTVRGAGLNLRSDLTNAEDSSASGLLSFESGGFTIGDSSLVNTSGAEYVAWCWDAGSGSAVSNTDGSITSTVKADATKGFSVATYTGNLTSGATVGHGLGVVPELVIVKRRNSTGVWTVYTSVTGATKYLELDSTATPATATNRWNDTAPTSSVISLGNTNNVNGSGSTYVAYSFASVSGYSKISSYTGTGSANLSVTGLGFRPAMVIIKRTDSVDRWLISDSTRAPLGDTEGTNIFLDANNAESGSSTTAMTFDSDGFTLKGTNGMINASGGSYIYIAFAGGQDLISPVNTDGSITSRVKENTAKGFSVVNYIGNNTSGATVGHGLGVEPELIIVKNRDVATNWAVWNTSLSSGQVLTLNTTNAASTPATAYWDDANNTSSVFALGTNNETNDTDNYVGYCFHSVSGYSSIGSYSGTGATGNSITGLGFKPAWLMVKRTDSTGDWAIFDTNRDVSGGGTTGKMLEANLSDAESDANNTYQFNSDGFEWLSGFTNTNASGGTYIYMAFADTRDATFFGDTSGNGNNWTPNKLNNTDVVPDSPVSGGNFTTLNPLTLSQGTLYEGNLRISSTAANRGFAVGTQKLHGKVYFEVRHNGGQGGFVGIGDTSNSNHQSVDFYDGTPRIDGSAGSALGAFSTGDICGVAVDIDTKSIQFFKNGSSILSTTYTTDVEYFPYIYDSSGGRTMDMIANFGQDSSFAGNETPQGNTDDNGVGDFYYAPPSGFLALTTGNLPAATITAPDEYFNTVLYSGNSSTQSITGVNFQPDWVWIKNRTYAYDNMLFDAVRGTESYLESNTTDAESNSPDVFTSFDADGFTVEYGPSTRVNESGSAYASWNWLAGNGTVSNTDGSITSTVSANTDAGFSVLTFTGDGSGSATVGTGLDTLDMVIVKSRDTSRNWWVAHKEISGNLQLDSTTSLITSAGTGGKLKDIPSLSNGALIEFVSGSSNVNNVNASGEDYVAYCFKEIEGYSKFSSFEGNGDTTNFVHCGFRPAWVMIKCVDSARDWIVFDNKRNTYNVATQYLYPNLNSAEGSTSTIVVDFLSNGFNLKGGNNLINTYGQTLIFAAFAEAPFKSANAR